MASAQEDTSELMSLRQLPQHLWEGILIRLDGVRDIARAQSVCTEWRDIGREVRSLGIVCRDDDHERARADETFISFKIQVVKILEKKPCIEQLRIEVERKLQDKTVPENERRRTDFWLTDPQLLRRWLPQMGASLQHLCIVDYGQQAIMKRSGILKLVSENCKVLKTLDLRNMFIDTGDSEQMPLMTKLTLLCVKVVGEFLQDINNVMPNLQSLALRGVFGVKRGILSFSGLTSLSLGLSTPAKDIVIDAPKLQKLELRMQCPSKLEIKARNLKYVALDLEVRGPRQFQEVERYNDGLITIKHGDPSFITLSSIAEKNPNFEKIFSNSPCIPLREDGRISGTLKGIPDQTSDTSCLSETLDVPCMGLLKDGRYLDLLNDNPVFIPSFTRLHECGNLGALPSAPPGLLSQCKWEIPDGLDLLMTASAF